MKQINILKKATEKKLEKQYDMFSKNSIDIENMLKEVNKLELIQMNTNNLELAKMTALQYLKTPKRIRKLKSEILRKQEQLKTNNTCIYILNSQLEAIKNIEKLIDK